MEMFIAIAVFIALYGFEFHMAMKREVIKS